MSSHTVFTISCDFSYTKFNLYKCSINNFPCAMNRRLSKSVLGLAEFQAFVVVSSGDKIHIMTKW